MTQSIFNEYKEELLNVIVITGMTELRVQSIFGLLFVFIQLRIRAFRQFSMLSLIPRKGFVCQLNADRSLSTMGWWQNKKPHTVIDSQWQLVRHKRE